MKILVTGGKGFIGSSLVKALSIRHEVETFDIVDGQDLRDREAVLKAVNGKDSVFHLAAVADLNWARENPSETMDINVLGTMNIAYACHKFGSSLYYASTCCVYGNQEIHPSHENVVLNPSEIYACSKLAGENIVQGYGHLFGIRYNLMRFATIYGEGMRPALGVYVFLKQAILNQPITVHGDGLQTRTLTYIDDLIEGVVKLFDSRLFVGPINLSTSEEISAVQMAKLIKKITKSKSPIISIPQRPGQTFKEQIDAKKAEELINWKSKTSFQEGLTKTYDWIKKIDPSML
jgi:nucleoside-diphosphate-sugar epimerase